jgi:hypothetical protein
MRKDSSLGSERQIVFVLDGPPSDVRRFGNPCEDPRASGIDRLVLQSVEASYIR